MTAKREELDLDPDIYAQWRASEIGQLTETLEDRVLNEMMGDPAGRDILDVGCGDGTNAIELARRGARITGVDISEKMIEAATAQAARDQPDAHFPDAHFYVATAEALPFSDQQFDIVLAKTILCFVVDPAPVFAEIARVLRPGGCLVIGELGKWSLWAVQRRFRAWFGSKLWRRARFRTAPELRSLAENAGLRVIEIRGAIYYPRSLFAARLLKKIDPKLGPITTFGAAFLAMKAGKDKV
ncbi:class I SAM-dependent methyltransferase [Emcibacter sp.]|uniref:class I SAM-dependent methyltransferase n=1 Tax=Emcibacter sp. TaxID=1979954 RepID=UPI002AA958EE|nr:class I SAM-dependent methyltransferase [Emcibacter sp.]